MITKTSQQESRWHARWTRTTPSADEENVAIM